MNKGYEENLDKNFTRALELCSNKFSHEELLYFLKSGNIPERQFAALELDDITTQEEAEILVSNLTGVDGKIREVTAFKLQEFVSKNPKLYLSFPKIFADATIDINANICRMIIDLLNNLKSDKQFAQEYTSYIITFIQDALKELDSFNFRDKKYTINKQLFKIYWCLEGINVFFSQLDEVKLAPLLTKCSKISEYTIREKVALVLNNDIQTTELKQLKNSLKNDENYYVKQLV